MKHAYRNHSINHSKSGSVPSFAQFAKSAKTASAPSLEMLEELVPCWLGIQIKNNTVVIDLMWVCIYICMDNIRKCICILYSIRIMLL